MQDIKKKQIVCLDEPVLAQANTSTINNKDNSNTSATTTVATQAPNTGVNKTNSSSDLFVLVVALFVLVAFTILAIKKFGKKSKLFVAFVFSATGLFGLLANQTQTFAVEQPAIPADCQKIGISEYEIAVKYVNEQGEEVITMVKSLGTGKPDADYELVYNMNHQRNVEYKGQNLETDLTIKSPDPDDELQVYEIVYRPAVINEVPSVYSNGIGGII